SSGSTFNNAGTFLDSGDHLFRYNGGAGLTFNNSGTLTKSGGTGSTRLEGTFNNSGTVNAPTRPLAIVRVGTHTGTYNAAAGATIGFNFGQHNLNPGVRFIGDGTIAAGENSNVQLTANTDLTIPNLLLSTGQLNGPKTVTITNRFDWQGGTLSGS